MPSSRTVERVAVFLGTRPEAIKLAPVVRELRRRSDRFECLVVGTGQHSEMLQQVFDDFRMIPEVELEVMRSNQSLASLSARLYEEIDPVLVKHDPDWVVVQGDTTTALVSAMCAYYRNIPIAHVEAGLRTGNRRSPFPEEINRLMIGQVADLHFAPTERAAENLRSEGVSDDNLFVTGNTAIDALLWMRAIVVDEVNANRNGRWSAALDSLSRMALVTSHRREAFGPGLEEICAALLELVERLPDLTVVYPVHLNPNVRGPVLARLGSHPRILLSEPVPYGEMVWLMNRADIILTDSGGIQEEAPSLGKPVLVLRDRTERPEAVESGWATLVGTDRAAIVKSASELLGEYRFARERSGAANPFGDGTAAMQIADLLATRHGGRRVR